MKTLRLSSIAFFFLCLFYSCTKDTSQTTSQQNSETLAGTRAKVLGGNPNEGNTPGNGQNNNENNSQKNIPAMEITFNPTVGVVGEDVVVTGTLLPNADNKMPDCGMLQLQQWINNEWVNVGMEKEISSNVNEVTFTFKPQVAGEDAYQFQLHYVANGNDCKEFDGGFSETYHLKVVEACKGLDITGKVVGEPTSIGGGLFEFTVQYEVSTCGLEFNKLKVQGGLTNATEVLNTTTPIGYDTWVPGGSLNNILRWQESSTSPLSTDKRIYTVHFTKAYSGSGTIELTGEWSVSVSLLSGDEQKDTFAKIYYTK